MLPISLTIKGFRSYVEETIDFRECGNIFVLLGENGNGKSSILQAIATALFWQNDCTDSKGAGMDACINETCEEMCIEFVFEMNNNKYKIVTRKMLNKSRELEFYINGEDQTEKVSETQQKINSVIKMSYDTFLDTVCLGQGQSSRFMTKKPTERKETLAQILDISKYEQYEKYAKEKKKEIKDKMTEAETKMEYMLSQLCNVSEQQAHISILQEDNVALESEIETKNASLEKILKEKAEYESIRRQSASILQTRQRLENNLSKEKKEISNMCAQYKSMDVEQRDYSTDIAAIDVQIEEKNVHMIDLREKFSALKTQKNGYLESITEIEHKISAFEQYNKGVCDFCGNVITAEHKASHIAGMHQQIETLQKKINDCLHEMDKAKTEGKSLNEQIKSLKSNREHLQQEEDVAKRQMEQKQALKEKIDYRIANYKEMKTQYEDNLAIEVVQIEDKSFDDEMLRSSIRGLMQQLTSNKSKIAVANEKIEQAKANEQTINQLKQELAQLKEQYGDYNSLATAFGKSGIPADIIEHDIPEIEAEANEVMRLLSNDAMSIKFITQKANAKTKRVSDTLDIQVSDASSTRTYETFSGGEKFRIDFSCHIGMAKFLAKRSGATIDFLIVDEGLGSQSEDARNYFVQSINNLRTIFKQIIVITHIPDLQEAFGTKVFVKKTLTEGSKITIVK